MDLLDFSVENVPKSINLSMYTGIASLFAMKSKLVIRVNATTLRTVLKRYPVERRQLLVTTYFDLYLSFPYIKIVINNIEKG